nr:alpha-L-rhamnosidase C-terminal domain-containing protein [uncultured Allomuricauda sp.]
MKFCKVTCLVQFLCITIITAQEHQILESPAAKWQNQKWEAHWITTPVGSTYDYGVYHFKKGWSLEAKPEEFIINVSADQRYKLYVNGTLVVKGPARGDILHWYFETIDIAPFLKEGHNQIAATVWNFGFWSAGAQISQELGFILQGNSEAEKVVNTNSTWNVLGNISYSPFFGYLQDVGPTEIIDGRKYPWGWKSQPNEDKFGWMEAKERERGIPQNYGTQYIRALTPRDIPLMESKSEPNPKVRDYTGLKLDPEFMSGGSSQIVQPYTKATILFDQGYLTNGYLKFLFDGGKDSKIEVTYAESLVDEHGNKGNRNVITGKTIEGFKDIFYLDGGSERAYETLWFRTYRYIQVQIETGAEAMKMYPIESMFTGYPFVAKANFTSNMQYLDNIWEVGWRTARLCAGETYYDCPYYEQLQYIGDTRIQALISLYVTGDDILMKKAINSLSWSRNSEGILNSRYPARYEQFIPPFSLYWINMLHDYFMLRPDDEFVKRHLTTVRTILEWYIDKLSAHGMLGPMPHWNFTDWATEWPWNDEIPMGGVPPGVKEGGSSILTLQLSYALGDAVDMFSEYGNSEEVTRYKVIQNKINRSVKRQCFDKERGLFADDIGHTSYSQHASIMAVLSNAVDKEEARQLMERILNDGSLIQATVYYKFYLFRALGSIDMGDEYLNLLGEWKGMLDNGLTTFAERPEPSRSDCHAWSASPLYDFFATVCGIGPAAPGFKKVSISPKLGKLNFIKAEMPHPNGIIKVHFRKNEKNFKADIWLPKNTSGFFHYGDQHRRINAGENQIKLSGFGNGMD